MTGGIDVFWWVILPYVAITVFVVGHIHRYRTDQFHWTTRSTQILEHGILRVAGPLFHYGVLAAIGGHVIGVLVPASLTDALGISEATYKDFSTYAGTLAAIATVAGFALLLYRRATVKRVRLTTSRIDVLTFGLLTVLIVLGSYQTVGINLFGAGFDYRENVAPWFRSVFLLNPDPDLMRGVDASYQVHVTVAWALYIVWPFSRLVHVWSVPIQYLGRPPILYRSRLGGTLPRFSRPADPVASTPRPLRRILDALPPASGAAVMGTAIVSVALNLTGHGGLSELLMWIALAVWVGLGLMLAVRFLAHRPRFLAEAATPASLTGVAGTAVLGTRLAVYGWSWAGIVLLAIAGLLALGLFVTVLQHWRRPTVGGSFLLTVSLQGIAVLCATLAASERSRGLLVLAVVLFVVAVGFYLWVLRDFDLRQLLEGRGDHWVAGGALAISALAAGRIVLAIDATGDLGELRAFANGVAITILVAAFAWLPLLIGGELLRPRRQFDARRWATVFPVGMYAAASFTVGTAGDLGWARDFARGWVWIALAVWLLIAAMTVVRGASLLRGERPAVVPERSRA